MINLFPPIEARNIECLDSARQLHLSHLVSIQVAITDTIDWMAYKKTNLFFMPLKARVQDQDPFVSGEKPPPSSQMAVFLQCLPIVKEMRELSRVSFSRALIPLMRASPSRPHLNLVTSQRPISRGTALRILHWGSGVHV